jgi:hypothetical protein
VVEEKKQEPKKQEDKKQGYDALSPEVRKQLEEEALKRVCKAGNVKYEEVLASEKREANDPLVDVNLGKHVVKINGEIFSGNVRVKRSVAEVLIHLAGTRKMRLLREKIANKGEVDLISGSIRTRIVGTVGDET